MTVAKWAAALAIAGALLVALDTALFDASIDDPQAEAAVVLGAAVWEDQPSPVFAARLDHAATLALEGRVQRVLLTGGTRESDLEAESVVGRRYLVANGVPDSLIALESFSRTTWQNLVCIRPLVDGPVLLVSDPLHLRRATAMARDLGIEAEPSATPTSRY
ncbi:YdcF family protein, partial [Rubrivirga sp.]|uniref:YdcF family protein n=1 Tax=Rubrivirga sp. TaxID=1885344 RepID=UPI003C790649